MNPIVSFARFLALGLHKSKVPTSFTSLSKVRAAVVVIDGDEKGVQALADSVNKYFASKNIRVAVFVVSGDKKHPEIKGATLLAGRAVNWFGKPRKGRRRPPIAVGENLFVNLVGRECFTAEYCAVASEAVFKVGRISKRKGLYNLYVSSEGHDSGEVFTQIAGMLDTVK